MNDGADLLFGTFVTFLCLGIMIVAVYFGGAVVGLWQESCLINSSQPQCIQHGYGNHYSNNLNLRVKR